MKIKHAFTSYSADDIPRAKEFYEKILGLNVKEDMGGLTLILPSGQNIFIYPKENHEPATFTVLNLIVESVEECVEELTKKGITMEQYDMPGIKTDARGIVKNDGTYPGPEAMAWFKDPAGNIIALIEE